MFKKLFVLGLLFTSLFGEIRELTDENFSRATGRGLVVVEFFSTWNEANKVVVLDTWDTFDAKVYRINIDLYPKIQSENEVVILPTLIFYDEGEEAGGAREAQGGGGEDEDVTQWQRWYSWQS